ncbi:MAG TPA: SUMF1/EgtB/PvdO family nonheme iron enzyme [Bacteroidia bacterium]|jgi:formylglycine-generating enzyme required for sulfatase activity|nr:SUMF1/EgtB/PvdO family nonheme iron enzyme [Bacteroidia bacterium]
MENKPMSDEQFDVLLRHAMLGKEDLFNEKNTEHMSTHVLDPNAENISVPENNIVSRLTKDLAAKKFNWRLNLLVLAGILSIATLVFIFRKQDPTQTIAHNDSANKALMLAMKSDRNTKAEELLNSNPLPVTNPAIFMLNDSTDDLMPTDVAPVDGGQHYVYTGMHIQDDRVLHYEDVPTLTDDQKLQTAKDKLKMLKDIVSSRKKVYSKIPMGTTTVNGVKRSVQSFIIKNGEVTNFEYRTFLNDLLVQSRFDDYLEAAPVKGGWTTIGIPEFENTYFESTKYNDFPVVNIPRKGAELYCEWLTTSLQDAVKKREVKLTKEFPVINDFRLPCDVEWIYAARGGHDSLNIKYPWQYVNNDVQNSNHCFLCNFNYTISKDHLSSSLVCPGFEKLKQGGFHREIITTAGLAIDTLLTAPVYSYNPNDYGLYCMMGNVSEMVWTWNADDPNVKGVSRAMGGNWNSDVNNVMIEASEQFVGMNDASPLIGFRPVMTVTN